MVNVSFTQTSEGQSIVGITFNLEKKYSFKNYISFKTCIEFVPCWKFPFSNSIISTFIMKANF
jgi:hypothetical protein